MARAEDQHRSAPSTPPAPDPLTDSLGARVQDIMEAAHKAASDLRREVEAETARRATEVRLGAEDRAHAILADAELRAAQYLEQCRMAADAFAGERIQRLASLSESLIQSAGAIHTGLTAADAVRRQLEVLIGALGAAAEEAAREASAAPIELAPMAPATPSTGSSPEATR